MRIIKMIIFSILSLSGILTPSYSSSADISEIKGIEVKDNNGITEIRITSGGPFHYTINKSSDPYQAIIELQNAGLGEFREKMTIENSGVAEIIPLTDESTAETSRFRIAFTVPVDIAPLYSDDTLTLSFRNPDNDASPADVQEEDIADISEAANKPFTGKTYVGEKINIDFQDADLIHIFRLIADISGYNIVVSPDVKGKFSMKLIDVPWDQALDVILRNYSLSKTVDGNIVRIAPTSVIAKEEEEIAQAKESQEKAGTLITKVYEVNYASVDEIKKAIETAKILSKRGFISADVRTSSVIIKDVDKMHAELGALIDALDIPTAQVSIEARIVEVNVNVAKELGIQWGMFWDTASSAGNKMTMQGLPSQSKGLSGNPFLVDLPATVSKGKGGGIGIGYINPSQLFTIDLQLSALESNGKGKVISNPKVTTNDNQEAKIMQGKKIPYQTISQDGTQTQFMDATLELTVTPHITPEGTIVMNLVAKKNEADFTAQVLGVPTIDIKEVKTQVLIKDQDTLVIGGIFKTINGKAIEKVPGLSEIPILGKLFQYEQDKSETNELLIFITPKIIKQPKS